MAERNETISSRLSSNTSFKKCQESSQISNRGSLEDATLLLTNSNDSSLFTNLNDNSNNVNCSEDDDRALFSIFCKKSSLNSRKNNLSKFRNDSRSSSEMDISKSPFVVPENIINKKNCFRKPGQKKVSFHFDVSLDTSKLDCDSFEEEPVPVNKRINRFKDATSKKLRNNYSLNDNLELSIVANEINENSHANEQAVTETPKCIKDKKENINPFKRSNLIRYSLSQSLDDPTPECSMASTEESNVNISIGNNIMEDEQIDITSKSENVKPCELNKSESVIFDKISNIETGNEIEHLVTESLPVRENDAEELKSDETRSNAALSEQQEKNEDNVLPETVSMEHLQSESLPVGENGAEELKSDEAKNDAALSEQEKSEVNVLPETVSMECSPSESLPVRENDAEALTSDEARNNAALSEQQEKNEDNVLPETLSMEHLPSESLPVRENNLEELKSDEARNNAVLSEQQEKDEDNVLPETVSMEHLPSESLPVRENNLEELKSDEARNNAVLSEQQEKDEDNVLPETVSMEHLPSESLPVRENNLEELKSDEARNNAVLSEQQEKNEDTVLPETESMECEHLPSESLPVKENDAKELKCAEARSKSEDNILTEVAQINDENEGKNSIIPEGNCENQLENSTVAAANNLESESNNTNPLNATYTVMSQEELQNDSTSLRLDTDSFVPTVQVNNNPFKNKKAYEFIKKFSLCKTLESFNASKDVDENGKTFKQIESKNKQFTDDTLKFKIGNKIENKFSFKKMNTGNYTLGDDAGISNVLVNEAEEDEVTNRTFTISVDNVNMMAECKTDKIVNSLMDNVSNTSECAQTENIKENDLSTSKKNKVIAAATCSLEKNGNYEEGKDSNKQQKPTKKTDKEEFHTKMEKKNTKLIAPSENQKNTTNLEESIEVTEIILNKNVNPFKNLRKIRPSIGENLGKLDSFSSFVEGKEENVNDVIQTVSNCHDIVPNKTLMHSNKDSFNAAVPNKDNPFKRTRKSKFSLDINLELSDISSSASIEENNSTIKNKGKLEVNNFEKIFEGNADDIEHSSKEREIDGMIECLEVAREEVILEVAESQDLDSVKVSQDSEKLNTDGTLNKEKEVAESQDLDLVKVSQGSEKLNTDGTLNKEKEVIEFQDSEKLNTDSTPSKEKEVAESQNLDLVKVSQDSEKLNTDSTLNKEKEVAESQDLDSVKVSQDSEKLNTDSTLNKEKEVVESQDSEKLNTEGTPAKEKEVVESQDLDLVKVSQDSEKFNTDGTPNKEIEEYGETKDDVSGNNSDNKCKNLSETNKEIFKQEKSIQIIVDNLSCDESSLNDDSGSNDKSGDAIGIDDLLVPLSTVDPNCSKDVSQSINASNVLGKDQTSNLSIQAAGLSDSEDVSISFMVNSQIQDMLDIENIDSCSEKKMDDKSLLEKMDSKGGIEEIDVNNDLEVELEENCEPAVGKPSADMTKESLTNDEVENNDISLISENEAQLNNKSDEFVDKNSELQNILHDFSVTFKDIAVAIVNVNKNDSLNSSLNNSGKYEQLENKKLAVEEISKNKETFVDHIENKSLSEDKNEVSCVNEVHECNVSKADSEKCEQQANEETQSSVENKSKRRRSSRTQTPNKILSSINEENISPKKGVAKNSLVTDDHTTKFQEKENEVSCMNEVHECNVSKADSEKCEQQASEETQASIENKSKRRRSSRIQTPNKILSSINEENILPKKDLAKNTLVTDVPTTEFQEKENEVSCVNEVHECNVSKADSEKCEQQANEETQSSVENKSKRRRSSRTQTPNKILSSINEENISPKKGVAKNSLVTDDHTTKFQEKENEVSCMNEVHECNVSKADSEKCEQQASEETQASIENKSKRRRSSRIQTPNKILSSINEENISPKKGVAKNSLVTDGHTAEFQEKENEVSCVNEVHECNVSKADSEKCKQQASEETQASIENKSKRRRSSRLQTPVKKLSEGIRSPKKVLSPTVTVCHTSSNLIEGDNIESVSTSKNPLMSSKDVLATPKSMEIAAEEGTLSKQVVEIDYSSCNNEIRDLETTAVKKKTYINRSIEDVKENSSLNEKNVNSNKKSPSVQTKKQKVTPKSNSRRSAVEVHELGNEKETNATKITTRLSSKTGEKSPVKSNELLRDQNLPDGIVANENIPTSVVDKIVSNKTSGIKRKSNEIIDIEEPSSKELSCEIKKNYRESEKNCTKSGRKKSDSNLAKEQMCHIEGGNIEQQSPSENNVEHANIRRSSRSDNFAELSLSFDVSAIANNKSARGKKLKYKSTPLVKRTLRKSSRVNRSIKDAISNTNISSEKLSKNEHSGSEQKKRNKNNDSQNDFVFRVPKNAPKKSSISSGNKSRRSVTFRPHSSIISPPVEQNLTVDTPKSNSVKRKRSKADDTKEKYKKSIPSTPPSKSSSKSVNYYLTPENKISYETSLDVSVIVHTTPKIKKSSIFHSTPKNRFSDPTSSNNMKSSQITKNQVTLYTTSESDAGPSGISYSVRRTHRRISSLAASREDQESYDSHRCMATKIGTTTMKQQSRVSQSLHNKIEQINNRNSSDSNLLLAEASSCLNRPPDSFSSEVYSEGNSLVQGVHTRQSLKRSAILIEEQETERNLVDGTFQMSLRSSRLLQQSTLYTDTQFEEDTASSLQNITNSDKSVTLISKFSKKRKPEDSIFKEPEKIIKKKRDPLPQLAKPHKWVRKQLYTFLQQKLHKDYPLEKRYISERIVLILCNFVDNSSYGHDDVTLPVLKTELNKYNICESQLEFYSFLNDFTPREFIKKVIPMGRAFGNDNYIQDSIKCSDPIL